MDFVPAHLAITVVIGRRQVTVIMAARLLFPAWGKALEPDSLRLAVAGFSFGEPLLFTLAAVRFWLRKISRCNPLPTGLNLSMSGCSGNQVHAEKSLWLSSRGASPLWFCFSMGFLQNFRRWSGLLSWESSHRSNRHLKNWLALVRQPNAFHRRSPRHDSWILFPVFSDFGLRRSKRTFYLSPGTTKIQSAGSRKQAFFEVEIHSFSNEFINFCW